MDALLTQRAVAQTIVDGGGDYVMLVKAHQPHLLQDVQLVFSDPPPGDDQPTAQTVDRGHGRIERRHVTASSALVGDRAWPGLRQTFALERTTVLRKTGVVRTETVYGVTSL